jgi:hypothetical protein
VDQRELAHKGILTFQVSVSHKKPRTKAIASRVSELRRSAHAPIENFAILVSAHMGILVSFLSKLTRPLPLSGIDV